ncbi:tryptophan-rich sensory protein [Diaminobutyricimonas aerilata]|uniref:Tryptophan-rich sensory protein n=1 Tax=Diaminobutyricimonas aerilata TaxID=1162967 RepID=A0A2M9CLE3_9MICO|nr:TspO/MBR family protein [Diaminobutyricimonas aerilata]PJJ72718.1 tryptophan-rich sensory protein [Diaminobutyricimonas aerilata]
MTATALEHRPTSPGRSALALVLFLLIAYAVAAFGSLSTIANVDGWYAEAEKASWSPPNQLFGPVWTVLYALMSIAAWLVWRRRDRPGARAALALYVAQLVLNAVWTPVFFGAYPALGPAALWIAAAIIVALDVAVLLTMLRFRPIDRRAAWLLVPYWAWVLFATTLNVAAAVLNS